MKKMILPAMALALVSLTSCGGGGFEGDVRKMANYECKQSQLEKKAETDEKAKKELEDLKKEAEAFGEKMRDKYKDKKDDKSMEEKAEKIYEEVMKKCDLK